VIPSELQKIIDETPELKRAYLVGGCVRDWLLGIPGKDYDIEVFGLGYEQLAAALARWGKVDLVGRSFGVVKLTTSRRETYDFSIPRRDSKTAPGHKGFEIQFDPALTPREAAARRDFTINSLMFDPRRGELLDFYGGEADLRNRVLRHTSPAFPEDPLRVLRGMQFAARFNLSAASETIELARSIKGTYAELARERVREEWFKWAEKSSTPSLGLRFLVQTEWIEHFPELNRTRGVPQDPEWHPEGDVFTHTSHCCDSLAALPQWQSADRESRIVYMLAILTHDFGKAVTTEEALKHGRICIVSPGHEHVSGELAESFLERINAPGTVRERVRPLVVNHMAHFETISDRAIRRLAKRLEPENIQGLLMVMTADAFGRLPKE
jgi:tRNA nucleotidyltransferase (CCA-adding enzyme)